MVLRFQAGVVWQSSTWPSLPSREIALAVSRFFPNLLEYYQYTLYFVILAEAEAARSYLILYNQLQLLLPRFQAGVVWQAPTWPSVPSREIVLAVSRFFPNLLEYYQHTLYLVILAEAEAAEYSLILYNQLLQYF
jgi:hypothetical protein